MSVQRSLTVISGDLDIDSDNTGAIESSLAEENIESDITKPGKVIIVRPETSNDADGLPDSVQDLAEIKVKVRGLASSDIIKFTYAENDPKLKVNGRGSIRIWKKPPNGPPASLSAFIQSGHDYSLNDLGMLPNESTNFYVQGVTTSARMASIKVEMSSNNVAVKDLVVMTLIPVSVTSDSNRDGTISEEDRYKATIETPFDIWPNDDDDVTFGEFQRPDYSNSSVDGQKDLGDFFPVFLDIQQLVKVLPPSASVKYKLKQADNAVNFTATSLTREAAFAYRDGNLNTGFGDSLLDPVSYAATKQITESGVELSTQFLNSIKDYNKGVILVEGRTSSTAPLVLTVEKDGVNIAELSLPLSIGPRILLLLHGMNSNTKTWDPFVTNAFGFSIYDSADIRNGVIEGAAPSLTATGVRCYRLQFGAFEDPSTTTAGLEGLTAAIAKGGVNGVLKNYLAEPTLKCGDFESFTELAQEVDDAIALLLARHPNAKIVMMGHSRGGMIGRKFLQGSSPRRSAVSGFLITSSPQKGSPIGRIYEWLDFPANQRPPPGSTNDDWQVVDFLCKPTAPVGPLNFNKDTVDVRRPVIKDMSDRSPAISDLNNPTQVANLPPKIMYGEIIYSKVDLGVMALFFAGIADYKIFDDSTVDGWDQLSTAAEEFILGVGKMPSDYPGDGLIPFNYQVFTTLPGFPAPGFPPAPAPAAGQNTIPRLLVTNKEVVHSGAPSEFQDLRSRLHLIAPRWFP